MIYQLIPEHVIFSTAIPTALLHYAGDVEQTFIFYRADDKPYSKDKQYDYAEIVKKNLESIQHKNQKSFLNESLRPHQMKTRSC